jgi:hypothetical protein
MSSSQQLYIQVFRKLHTLHPTMHLKLLAVWVWVVVGLIQGQSVQLSEIANHIPGDTLAVGRIARVRRWLASKSITSRTLEKPLIEEVLRAWSGREVTIILDGCATMLEHVARLLKPMRRITFLADRGFRSREWARKCCELKWDYIIRIGNITLDTKPQRSAENQRCGLLLVSRLEHFSHCGNTTTRNWIPRPDVLHSDCSRLVAWRLDKKPPTERWCFVKI